MPHTQYTFNIQVTVVGTGGRDVSDDSTGSSAVTRRNVLKGALGVLSSGVAASCLASGEENDHFDPVKLDEVPARVDEQVADGVESLMYNGDPGKKADLLLVGKDYESEETMLRDFAYFMDFDGDNRGLFDIYPFSEYRDRFNIWTYNAGDAIADYDDPREGRGLKPDSKAIFDEVVPFADYKTVLAKGDMGRSGFAHPGQNECWVDDVSRNTEQDEGAKGFLHEFGHAFANLSDEYFPEEGDSDAGDPNCAETRAEAEEKWGDVAAEYNDVGFYEGCGHDPNDWRPHESSIMGNGGTRSYGRVNERAILDELAKYE